MFKIQSIHRSVLHRTILLFVSIVWNFAALDIVHADEQSFVYASDLIQGQRNINSDRDISQYQHEIPLTFFDNNNSAQRQYTYLPPTQKIGSNPISNPQHNYQFPVNNDADNYMDVTGNIYHYLQPIQKIGTNPFRKSINQYVDPHKLEQFFASSYTSY